jgi:hypothetical protein
MRSLARCTTSPRADMGDALTAAEQAERDRVVAERTELRRQEVAAMRAVTPACETEDDPPVVWRKPARMGPATKGSRAPGIAAATHEEPRCTRPASARG